jgi:virulence-associated protein VapD
MAGIGHNRGQDRMYAIVFDLDTNVLQATYHNATRNNAYSDIRRVLEQRGFEWQQGSTYFGNERVTPVDCVLVAQELKRVYPWFQPSVRDFRMLRIEENNDLLPALN